MNPFPLPPPAPSGPPRLAVRVLALAALLALANAWAVRHLGGGLRSLGVVNGFVALVGFFFAYFGEQEKSESKEEARAILFRLVDDGTLAGLAACLLVVTSLVSSVTVLADGVPSNVNVFLSPEGGERDAGSAERLAGAADAVRYVRLTSPFGRPLYLEADGYLRHPFDLYPWSGETIRLSHDLEPIPAILLRVPVDAQPHLDGGILILSSPQGAAARFPTDPRHASILLGRRASIPSDVQADWRLELTVDDADPTTSARALLGWKRPLDGGALRWLTPGTPALAEFVSQVGAVCARLDFVVGGDAFQDFVLDPVKNESPGVSP